jgi:ribosomal protein S18 acetylase RimI-like enzyme
MNIQLTQMNREDYDKFLATAIVDYADNKIKNGTWSELHALEKSKATFASLLPDQLHTKDNYLRNIEADSQKIGFIWYMIKEEEGKPCAYLYEVYIQPTYRNKGYGSEAIKLFVQDAETLGAETVWMHVFGHNEQALHLYKRLGFEISDYTLKLKK